MLITAGICVPIAMAVLCMLLKLETEFRSYGLYVRYFPSHINFRNLLQMIWVSIMHGNTKLYLNMAAGESDVVSEKVRHIT